jgi:hypothetical protein
VLCFAPFVLSAALCAISCDTHAVGVDECRAIEAERCTAARNCDFGVDSDADETACQRFAHDNCLHGLSSADAPRSSELNRCVTAIRQAGACAKDSPDGLAQDCGIRGTFASGATVCEVVEDPEQASECSFLAEVAYVDAAAPVVDSGGVTSSTEAGAD